MDAIDEIKKLFLDVMTLSLNTEQANHIAQEVNGSFNIYNESGFGYKIPIPRQTAAETILHFFRREEDIVDLFTAMLKQEGTRFHGVTMKIHKKNEFIKLLKKHKWIYDEYLTRFYRDPFYANEINFLKSIRMIDLRKKISHDKIINDIKKAAEELSLGRLDWRMTVRMYELDAEKEKLVKKIIELLLSSQKLKKYSDDMYICLKELSINASKANYKILFEKFISSKEGVTSDKNYEKFLELFKQEIKEHSNTRLSELARQEDMFFNVFFQSTENSLAIWVSNYASISKIERKRILEKLKENYFEITDVYGKEDRYSEGAGFGMNLVINVLSRHSSDPEPLKIVFYPEFVKIGFELKRTELSG